MDNGLIIPQVWCLPATRPELREGQSCWSRWILKVVSERIETSPTEQVGGIKNERWSNSNLKYLFISTALSTHFLVSIFMLNLTQRYTRCTFTSWLADIHNRWIYYNLDCKYTQILIPSVFFLWRHKKVLKAMRSRSCNIAFTSFFGHESKLVAWKSAISSGLLLTKVRQRCQKMT